MTGLRPQPLDPADHLELQRLGYLYCHAVDRGDLTLLRSLYTDDGYDDHGAMFSGTADDYVAWLPKMLAGVDVIRHEITNALFVVDSDRAQGQLINNAYHRMGTTEVVIGGRYLDTYRRTPGGWRIQHRSLVLDTFQQREASEAGGFIGKGVARGTKDATDPGYALELFARVAAEAGD
ncbi:MAG: hypothetical protein JWO22_2782 [Frankiales bacterium]|nr:hypothetical protein [Frankiales bacterium]